MPDDFASSISTSGSIKEWEYITGEIQSAGDIDWIKLENLKGGRGYYIDVEGLAFGFGATLEKPSIEAIYTNNKVIQK